MKKFTVKLSLLIIGLSLVFSLFFPASSKAAFNANNLMDDSVFNNTTSMNASQIDAFLNTFPSSCISTNNGFTSADVTGYNPSQGFLYGSNVSAGTVINNASQAYDLNPQVVLATLQKEQSLVSGGAGCHYETPPTQNPCPNPPYGTSSTCVTACQYAGGCVYIAMGYDCPQYCVPGSTGFSKQIIKATWKLKFTQQRSLGNYNWNIQKPGWDNSDQQLLFTLILPLLVATRISIIYLPAGSDQFTAMKSALTLIECITPVGATITTLPDRTNARSSKV